MSTSKTPRERYDEKLMLMGPDRPDCIGWDAKIDKYGNAQFSYTTGDGQRKSVNATRWEWEAVRGPVPEGYKVSNDCGLKSCQNLDHWRLKPTNHGKTLWELYELKFTKSDDPNACWPWQEKSRDKDGYGIFSYRDPETKETVTRRATRWAWEQLYGPISADMMVCHTCDVPCCQRPSHWFLGPASVNVQDMVNKGRQYSGERHHKAKVTQEIVEEIRRLKAAHPQMTHREIAEQYGINRRSVTNILNNKTWKKR